MTRLQKPEFEKSELTSFLRVLRNNRRAWTWSAVVVFLLEIGLPALRGTQQACFGQSTDDALRVGRRESNSTDSSGPSNKHSRPNLGFWFGTYTPAERKALGIPPSLAVVGSVFPDSPAAVAGIQVRDAIRKINGQDVADTAAAVAALYRFAIGETANLEIVREGQTITVSAQFAPEPEHLLVYPFRDAVQGNPQSQYTIGVYYLLGDGVTKDAAKGRYWLERAAEGGVGSAIGWLATIYETGDGVPQDLAKARTMLELLAAEDVDWAQVRVAPMFLNGVGGSVDFARGLQFYERASAHGHAEASFEVGKRYFDGVAVNRDYAKAFTYYLRAAEKGHQIAAARVGNMYGSGTGTVRDTNQAVQWLSSAAEAGIAEAQHDLGALYSKGDGVQQDWGLAAKWLSAAAAQGKVDSMFHLGELFYNSKPRQTEKAVHWLTKAADAGNLPACSYLGAMYLDGLGVSRDTNRAAPLVTKAAEGGLPRAQYLLGRMYSEGSGVPHDYRQAVHWLTTAISKPELESGNRAKALALLGTIHDGIGASNNVTRNSNLAVDYYRQAAELGQLDSQRLYGQRLRDQRRYSEAITWLHEAATRGDRAAQNDLGTMYYYGQGVTQSREEAIAWWLKAYRQGSTTARDSLKKLGIDTK